jgi:peptide/nickel transport system permease protein
MDTPTPVAELRQTPSQLGQRELSPASEVALTGGTLERPRIDTPGRRTLRRFRKHRLAVVGLIFILVVALTAIFADFIAPYGYQEQDLSRYREGPTAAHWLGTDSYGRDVLSRLIYGSRVSLSVGLIAVFIAEGIAVILGSIAGYYGGKSDWIVMRLVDVMMAFPWLIMVIMMVSLLGPSVFNAMIAIGLFAWTVPTRLVRGQILAIREMDYILAAHSVGAPSRRIILRHILPGVVGPLVVSATFLVASAILMEAGLSFLGLGVQPPIASWGNMMFAAMELIILQDMPWLWVPPGVMVALSVLAINFIGDGLRDALDPKGMLQAK